MFGTPAGRVMAERAIAYELHEGAQGLAALQAAWEQLEGAGASHIFQTYAYAQLWQRTIGTPIGAKPLLVALREDERVVGIFPACRVRESGVPILTWLGAPHVIDYGDVLFDPQLAETPVDDFVAESLRLLARHSRGAFLYLTNVREDARAIEPLRSRLRTFKTTTAPFVPIAGTWDDYLFSLGRNLRHTFDRRLRRLSEEGEVGYKLMSCDDPDVAPTLAKLVAFQRARFDSPLARTNLFNQRYVDYRTQQATAERTSRVATVTFDGTCIAASLHAVFRDRFYCLATSFDREFAAHSPGLLIHAFVIRSCFENGWDPCDFCWGNEAHKYRWTDQEVTLTTLVSAHAGGAMLSAAAVARRRLSQTLSQLRDKSRTASSNKS